MILVGHGGRSNEKVVRSIAASLEMDVEVGFVDGEPSVEEVLDVVEGEVVVVPVLLSEGHTLRKLREVLDGSGRDYRLARPLLDHPHVVRAVGERARERL